MVPSPKVSIVIPVYNGSNYLREAIDSALVQTYQNIEIIVVNDGSTDDGATDKIAKSYGDKIRYFTKDNGGVATALNMGIKEMTGEFFSWLSHDDLYEPHKIEFEIRAIQNIEESVVVYSDYFLIDENSNKFEVCNLPHVPPGGMRCFLAESTILHGCTLLIPRESLLMSGGFSTTLRTTQDQELWFRLASHYLFIHVSVPLVSVRSHTMQGSVILRDVAVKEQEHLYLSIISNLSETEINTYSGAEIAYYYLRLYRNFRLARLQYVTETVANKISNLLKAKRYPICLLLRFVWHTLTTTRFLLKRRRKFIDLIRSCLFINS